MHLFYASLHAPVRRLKQFWLQVFWLHPDNLWALKVTTAIALLLIPCNLLGDPFLGCTLALGAVGAALAENDDHPLGRMRSLMVTILSFIIVSWAVEMLRFSPWIFGIVLMLATFWLIILGGLSARFQGITFGALLVFVYAMLGVGVKPWYYQPILLPAGGLTYGLISLLLLSFRPYRLLKEQLKNGYFHLADYIEYKARLFPCTPEEYKTIRIQLAWKNTDVGRSIDSIKDIIYSCLQVLVDKYPLSGVAPHYRQWMLLQQLHERAASSHQRYDLLSRKVKDPLLVEGFGQYMRQIGVALRRFGDTIITGQDFRIPTALHWTQNVLERQLAQSAHDPEYPTLCLLFDNLNRIVVLLQQAERYDSSDTIPTQSLQFRPLPVRTRLRALLQKDHPRFRHAVRLTICIGICYSLIYLLHIDKGTWIVLTALFVCQQSYVATRQRIYERIIGTIAGVVVGVALARIMPTIAGQTVLLLASIFTFFYWLRKRYAYAVAFITMFVIAAFNLQTGTGAALMGYRLLDTVLGAAVAYLTVRFIWPDWQYRHLPQLLHVAIDKTQRYFLTIYSNQNRGPVYYHNRRTAHKADNALATAWRGMMVEPKNKRFLQRKAYALTILHHSLLSYISALGAHQYKVSLSADEIDFCKRIAALLDVASRAVEHRAALPFPTEGGKPLPLMPIPDHTIAHAAELCREIKLHAATDEQGNIVIIYNIAATVRDLLKECTKVK